MKRLIITEDEKKRIKLLYEVSTFVQHMSQTFGANTDSFEPLDWSTLEKTDPKRAEYGKNLSKVTTAFQKFTNNAWKNKQDISKTISYLEAYNIDNKYQKQWLDSAIKTLKGLKTAIDSSKTNNNNTNNPNTTPSSPQNSSTTSISDWRSKLNQQFGINQ
jgi:hypothetical protein